MRPEILFPAFRPITSLKGCGPRTAELIGRVAGTRLLDLWWHLPVGLVDRRHSPKISDALDGGIATMTCHVDRHLPPRTPRLPYKIICSDETGQLTLVYFNGREDYLRRTLPEGETRVISGKVEYFDGAPQMTHPDHVVTEQEAESIRRLEPVYPLTAGLAGRSLNKIITQAIAAAPDLPEWIDPAFLARQKWPSWHGALAATHAPSDPAMMAHTSPARSRLAYDELLANQLALALVRANLRRQNGRIIQGDDRLRARVRDALPWQLTNAQLRSLAEIDADLASHQRMLRLLQGDVGSGKTIVALFAMLTAVEAGAQAALMAPTEILARQHFATIEPLAKIAGLRIALLTGRDKGKSREALLAAMASGEIQITIGTHALFQDDVAFRDLALVVVDEQHRFGVHQRLALSAKGQHDAGGVDVLVMTATPIPRTLALTAYGDMDVSKLDEKPPGRKPIDTRSIALSRMDEVIAAVRRKIENDEQTYWVCPLIEESELVDLAAAEDRYAKLKALLGETVGIVHGRMTAPEKDKAMASFAEGRTKVLVSTTVIEVGVDVRQATLMIVEHAERFGLAQLHQLRGRVGRGEKPSSCLLLYAAPLGETAKARLKIMRETEDGFLIAEEDLRLRGAGELLGTRQSGSPEFRIAQLDAHAELLQVARDDTKLILATDARLTGPRGAALRVLLYLFERDAAIKLLRSG